MAHDEEQTLLAARKISILAEHAKDAESRRIPFEPRGRLAQLLKRRRFPGPNGYAFGGPAGQFQGTIRTAWEWLVLLAHGIEPTRTRARRGDRSALARPAARGALPLVITRPGPCVRQDRTVPRPYVCMLESYV